MTLAECLRLMGCGTFGACPRTAISVPMASGSAGLTGLMGASADHADKASDKPAAQREDFINLRFMVGSVVVLLFLKLRAVVLWWLRRKFAVVCRNKCPVAQ